MSKPPKSNRGTAGADTSELMQRVAGGDRHAFGNLFLLLAPKVKAYLIRLGCDTAQSDDLAQDVMITLWHKAPQFDPARASLMTWIFVIARNCRIDMLRREHSTVTYGHVPPESEDLSAPSDVVLADRQHDVRMRGAIASLPQDQQEVIRRSFFEEEPHSAIARSLGLPLGTVKSRLRMAFSKLRAQLEDSR